MRPILRRGLATGSVLVVCLGFAPAQQPASQGAAAPTRLPSSMLRVGRPGSATTVELGISARQALATVRDLYPSHERRRLQALHNIRSELGTRQYRVESFFLGRHAVTNAQYLAYLRASARAGQPARFPYHWWAETHKADLEARRAQFVKLYPDAKHRPLLYWLDHWRELPHAIPAGQEQWPVCHVSYGDALRCAGFYGMRLPTEPEWTLAANGGRRERVFVFGAQLPDDLLTRLGMAQARQRQAPRPVGGMGPLAVGPFGHADLFGQVWELVIPVGFRPQNGAGPYQAQAKLLQRDRFARRVTERALEFGDQFAVVKGGSFYSLLHENWVELRINTRAQIHGEDVLPGVGFRLAKTDRPGFDLALARLRLDRPRFLIGAQEPDHARQVGVERYRLTADRAAIDRYDAVSYVPLSHLSLASNANKSRFSELTWRRPEMLGVLIGTVPLKSPALARGVYVVHYRAAGVPKLLREAVNAGRRALRKQGAAAQGEWRGVIERHGYRVDELLKTPPATLLRQVYLKHGKAPRFAVPTGHDVLVYRDRTGQWVATQKVPRFAVKSTSSPNDNRMTRAGARIEVATHVPIHPAAAQKQRGRKWLFEIPLELADDWR